MLDKMGTTGASTVDSDSVNLGSNPSSPATIKAHEIGTSGDFGPAERAAKSEQNAYTGCTEPGTAGTLDIPTEPKAFQAWCYDNGSRDRWPNDLWHSASRAYQSLKTKDRTAWNQSFALRKAAKADWSAFTTAYREHVGVRS